MDHHDTPVIRRLLDRRGFLTDCGTAAGGMALAHLLARDGLWAALWQRGVRGKMWRVIRAYYGHIQSRVHVNGEVSEWFEIETGVRQGCVLSPILFDFFFDGLVRELKELGLGIRVDSGDLLCSLAYADDLVLLADSAEDLQTMVDKVSE